MIEKPGVSFELLSAVRYVCKDIWIYVHKKKIDKLETDNAGTYILHDANYQWVLPLTSSDKEVLTNEWIRKRHLAFSVGFLKGCFEVLGWKCDVSVKIEGSLPYCKFHCKFEELEKELEEKRNVMKTPGPKNGNGNNSRNGSSSSSGDGVAGSREVSPKTEEASVD